MKPIAIIPARYGATRFPGKLMQLLHGKTVIRTTYENTLATGLFDEVLVATDSELIYQEIEQNGGKAVMSLRPHETGTDRIAEAAQNLNYDIIVNVQGDEPFIRKEPLEKLLKAFEADANREISVVTLMQELKESSQIEDPNYVKVVTDHDGFALYFSRAPIPYCRDKDAQPRYFEHIGVYGFRKEALLKFAQLTPLINEKAEKIECLRFLEHGMKIKLIETDYMGIEIDTPEDLERANQML